MSFEVLTIGFLSAMGIVIIIAIIGIIVSTRAEHKEQLKCTIFKYSCKKFYKRAIWIDNHDNNHIIIEIINKGV